MTKSKIYKPDKYSKILVPSEQYPYWDDNRLLIPFTSGRKIGFMNKNRVVVIPPKYSAYYGNCYTRDDYVRVEEMKAEWRGQNKANSIQFLEGLINYKGEEVYPCEYLGILPSFNPTGLFTFISQRREYTVITAGGKEIVPYGKYTWIDGFDQGFARVKVGGSSSSLDEPEARWGIIDESGNEVKHPELDYVWPFYGKNKLNVKLKQGDTTYVFFLDTKTTELYNIVFIPFARFIEEYGTINIYTYINEYSGDECIKYCTYRNHKNAENPLYISKELKTFTYPQLQEVQNYLSIVSFPSGRYCLCLETWEEIDICK